MQVQQFSKETATIAPSMLTALDIVKQVYARLTEGNFIGFLELCADDIEWVVNGPATLVKCQSFYGKGGVSD